MRIDSVRLVSFGPFADSGELVFVGGMNLLVGQNNSGKSAVLKSFKADALNWPHRSLTKFREIDLEPSVQWLRVRVSGAEIRDALLAKGGEIHFPTEHRPDTEIADFEAKYLSSEQTYIFQCTRRHSEFNKVGAEPSHGGFPGATSWSAHLRAARPSFSIAQVNNEQLDTAIELMAHLWTHNIFRFDAERLSIGRCTQDETENLRANASNLPAVLQRMQGRQPGLFAKLEARVREVIPSVHGIRATPVNSSEVEIVVWPTSHMDRQEHGFSLNESGTGVAQVIAILTAVMTREQSVIVIDEINSFLHPAAVKALLRILVSEFQGHQYILSTHSAEVISSSNAATLHVVKRDGFDSACSPVSADNVSELRELSDLLGISIGDIFAADRVLWVEGRTEEICFPFLMNHWDFKIPRGLIISPVVATGDFAGKKNFELVLSVYNRLSTVTLPLVRSVTFSFDREELTDNELIDLNRRANGRMRFLPRRHLECYLVDASAIAAFINNRDADNATIEAEAVERELLSRAAKSKYHGKAQWKGELSDENWLAAVDAANLIKDTIASLTENRVTFAKTSESLELLERVLELNPSALTELRDYLQELLELVIAH